MLPRSQRLTSAQFDRAFAHSQSVRHPLVALKAHFRADGSGEVRAAFVVPKKQSKAVGRNHTRRRLRERYRLHTRRNELSGCDLIFLATPATHDASGAELDDALDEVIRRMGRKLGETRNREGAGLTSSPNRVPGGTQDSEAVRSSAELTPFSNQVIGKAQDLEESVSPAELLTASKLKDCQPTRLEEDVSPAEPVPASTGQAKPETPSQTSLFAAPALAVIRFYQRFVSPGLPPSCRFYPSCSRYTYGAIERFGLARGLWLGAYRVCRCHPWNPGGVDEVPAHFPAPRIVKERALAKLKVLISRRRFDSPRN